MRMGAPMSDDSFGPARDFIGYGANRPQFEWPGGAKVALNFVVNYEEASEYSLASGDDHQETVGEFQTAVAGPTRDLRTESVFEYGSRIGAWRLFNLFDALKTPLTVFATAVALERNPELCEYLARTQHEICAHGWRWSKTWELSREEEKARIILAVETIERLTGKRSVGWNCRNSATVNTRELLVEIGGFLYDSDAYNDDLPYIARVGDRDHLVIPYTVVHNDMRFVTGTGYGSPSDFSEVCKKSLDYLLDGASEGSSMMSVGVHARYSGQPSRAAALRDFVRYAMSRKEVWITRRVDIAQFWRQEVGHAQEP